MGQRQAAEQGRWLNRAPNGYDMVNGQLVANDMAPVVQRIFSLRAAGASYPEISRDVGMDYSTVRHISLNRVYQGEVKLGVDWFAGIHSPLVSPELFDAAQRAHTPGKRRSKDLLSGLVRCGLCGRVAGVHYNNRGQAIYRCRHRGEGCPQSGRSANGLHRAAVLGLRVLADDVDLQNAIRHQLNAHRHDEAPQALPVTSATASLNVNQAAAKTSVLSSMICAGGVLLGVGGAAGLTDLGVIAAGASAGPWVTGALALVWLGIAAFEGYTIATTC